MKIPSILLQIAPPDEEEVHGTRAREQPEIVKMAKEVSFLNVPNSANETRETRQTKSSQRFDKKKSLPSDLLTRTNGNKKKSKTLRRKSILKKRGVPEESPTAIYCPSSFCWKGTTLQQANVKPAALRARIDKSEARHEQEDPLTTSESPPCDSLWMLMWYHSHLQQHQGSRVAHHPGQPFFLSQDCLSAMDPVRVLTYLQQLLAGGGAPSRAFSDAQVPESTASSNNSASTSRSQEEQLGEDKDKSQKNISWSLQRTEEEKNRNQDVPSERHDGHVDHVLLERTERAPQSTTPLEVARDEGVPKTVVFKTPTPLPAPILMISHDETNESSSQTFPIKFIDVPSDHQEPLHS